MKLIKYISDNILGLSKTDLETDESWNTRIAVRTVMQDDGGKVALMYVKEYNIYKLPGGGIDDGETLKDAFDREILEETGSVAEISSEIGASIEKRDTWKLFQISHCFLAKLKHIGEQKLTKEEVDTGFSLFWTKDIDEAIELVSKNKSDRYDDIYIKSRDSEILKIAKGLTSTS